MSDANLVERSFPAKVATLGQRRMPDYGRDSLNGALSPPA